jgi:membrane fusion protein (multidrug efflux system)
MKMKKLRNENNLNFYKIITMKTYKIIFFAVILVLAGGLFYSCGGDRGQTKENNQKLPLVKVQDVKPQLFAEKFTVVGVVKPYASAKISSEEGGLILSIEKDKGSSVAAGQIVVRLKKDVEGATYDQLLAQYELAKLNFEKQQQLYDDNATTEIAYLTAKWQLEAAAKGLEVVKTHMSKGFIRSPISGVVEDKFMNKGEMSAPGIPILSIVDVSRVKISAGMPEKYVDQVKKGQDVKITVDVLPGSEFSGKINYIAPSLSQGSRTFEIEIVINNKQRLLKPEMSANVELARSETENAIVIPQDYIIDYGDEKFLFVLEGGVAKKRNVELGGRNENLVLVKSGLNEGDKLIIEGFQTLNDGEKVKVVE